MIEYIQITDLNQCEKLYEIAVEINRKYYTPITGRAQVDYMMEKFMSPVESMKKIEKGADYYFVREDGNEIGYFCLEYREGGEVFLSKYYIREDKRGQGYGKSAFKKILEMAKCKSKTCITLTVNKGNTASVAVYKRLGFYVYHEEVTDIGGGFFMDDYFMRYDIV